MNKEIKELIKKLKDEKLAVYAQAFQSLVDIGKPTVPSLIEALEGQDKDIRQYVIVALGKIGDQRAVPALVEAANGPNVFVRMLAIGALGDIGGDQVLPIIIKALEDEDLDVYSAALHALSKLGIEEKDLAHIESQYRLCD